MTIEAIKTAIQELTDSERSQVVSWLETFREQEWDREIERDFAPGGRGEWLLDELNREIDEGLTLPIEEACRENRRRH